MTTEISQKWLNNVFKNCKVNKDKPETTTLKNKVVSEKLQFWSRHVSAAPCRNKERVSLSNEDSQWDSWNKVLSCCELISSGCSDADLVLSCSSFCNVFCFSSSDSRLCCLFTSSAFCSVSRRSRPSDEPGSTVKPDTTHTHLTKIYTSRQINQSIV